MVKIIETNLSCDSEWHVKDHQSRVIEVPNWEEYINLFKNYNGYASGRDYTCLTYMDGCTLPQDAIILGETHDDFHLTCKMKIFNGFNEIKLAYLIR